MIGQGTAPCSTWTAANSPPRSPPARDRPGPARTGRARPAAPRVAAQARPELAALARQRRELRAARTRLAHGSIVAREYVASRPAEVDASDLRSRRSGAFPEPPVGIEPTTCSCRPCLRTTFHLLSDVGVDLRKHGRQIRDAFASCRSLAGLSGVNGGCAADFDETLGDLGRGPAA
jgi:hypothetical protein